MPFQFATQTIAKRKTHIGTLHVRRAEEDNTAIRLYLAKLLGTADLRLLGASPSSVLIIREFTDPLPELIAFSRHEVRVKNNWERAVQNSLTQIGRQATCPVNGYIPSNANAVIFSDEAEMLACLALDFARNQANTHWWWKFILRPLPDSSVGKLAEILRVAALYVPAVTKHLTEWGQADPLLNAITSEQAMTILSDMTRAYEVPHVFNCLSQDSLPKQDFTVGTGRTGHRSTPQKKQHSINITGKGNKEPPKAPWHSWLALDKFGSEITREKLSLMGIGLSLYHHPVKVRSDEFLNALRRWWEYQPDADSSRQPDVTLASHQSESTEIQTALLPADTKDEKLTVVTIPNSELSSLKPQKTPSSELIGSDAQPYSKDKYAKNETQPVPPARNKDDHPIKFFESASQHVDRSPDHRHATQDITFLRDGGLVTRIGGVLFLINMMRLLDLPACFDPEWRFSGAIGSWGLLEILGRTLVDDSDEGIIKDPLWTALAELDGRKLDSLPETDLIRERCYGIPPSWLALMHQNQEISCFWSEKSGIIRVWTDLGFIISETPVGISDEQTQLKDVLQRYGLSFDSNKPARNRFQDAPVDQYVTAHLDQLGPNFKYWLRLVLPFIRLFLKCALNASASDVRQISEALLPLAGRLYVTSTHVDLVMRLDDISLPVRLAGLDRDPGWLPEFGRVIKFHFE